MSNTCFAVLGLGEAGTELALDLVAAGVRVRGYDPIAEVPVGVEACASEADAVSGAAVVMSVNSAEDAPVALRNGVRALGERAVWADLNTAGSRLKTQLAVQLAEAASRSDVSFADVALMAPVPGRGLRTPMLASGAGAERFAALVEPLGASVTVLSDVPGDAATRKLLRSVFFKGTAAAVVEALTAARAVGLEDWLEANIADELTRSGPETVGRLVRGSVQHAVRRAHEMTAATELLEEIGVPARVAAASRDLLRELAESNLVERQS